MPIMTVTHNNWQWWVRLCVDNLRPAFFFVVICVYECTHWPAVCGESAKLTAFLKFCILLQRKQWSKVVPTLWWSFPFLATVGLYFLSGLRGVFRHSVCALRDVVIILILESGGVRGEKPLRSKSASVQMTEKSALLVSHPGWEGNAWEVEKEDSANGLSWWTRWTSDVGVVNPLLKWSGMFCPSGESRCVPSLLPQTDAGSSGVWAPEPGSSNTGMSALPVSENWGGGGGISAGTRKECENHNRGNLICSSWVNDTDVVWLMRQEVTQVDRRRPLWFFQSSAQRVRVWEELPGWRRRNYQHLRGSVRTLFSDIVQHQGGLSWEELQHTWPVTGLLTWHINHILRGFDLTTNPTSWQSSKGILKCSSIRTFAHTDRRTLVIADIPEQLWLTSDVSGTGATVPCVRVST